jgi:ribA/ribD-fused uncharacterized protein
MNRIQPGFRDSIGFRCPAQESREDLDCGHRLVPPLPRRATDNHGIRVKLWITALFAFAAALVSIAADAPARNPNWDEKFDGVVHDTKRVAGFVAEYRWLSNFYLCRVEWDGRVYGSSEAAYHSAKYPPAERDVFTTLDPDSAKKLSRTKPYDTAGWERRKEQSMRDVIWAKFSQNPDLAKALLATGDRHLEETNWWGDKFWGVFQGEGENKLGQILMETRARLAKSTTPVNQPK